MKKNLLFLCLMLLLASVSGFAQGPTTVTIGTGTNDSYNLPINNYYKNSWSEMIYPASQITETGYITSIGFDVSSVVDGYMCNTLTIYMGVTSNEAHNSNADWLPMEALTEVYSSIDWPLPTATGWLTFDLDNPFQYESNDNLVIVVSKTMPNYTNALKFRYTEGATNCCLYRRNDNDLSYASHPGANTGTLTNQLPNLQLTFSTTTDFCHAVTDFAVTDISAYEATFAWNAPENASNYILQYKTTDADWEDNDVVTVYPTATPYTLTNLTPSTNYVARIANICDNEYSGWRYIAFTTLCAPEATPYSEDFNASSNIPDCWEKLTGLISDAFNGFLPAPTTSGWSFNNTHAFGQYHPKVNIYSTNCRYWLVSPAIDLNGLENPELTFDIAMTGYNNDNPGTTGDDDRFLVLVSTNGGASWSADNAIEWNNSGTGDYIFNQIPATGDEITIPLEQYAGQTIRIAFYGESTMSNGDNDLHIDNVYVGESSTCQRPAQLQATNITTHSAEISWVEKGEATSWTVEYGQTGFTPGSGTVITVDGHPTTILYGLTPSTDYEFHVKADCGTELSNPKSATFRTADCQAITLPFTEDFESYTVSTTASTGIAPTCWELMQEDVAMTDATRPQIYYKNSYAHSGDYSLLLNYSGIYAMPALADNIEMKHVHLEMYLRQPRSYYTLEVGVWEDDGTFVPVATFNNSTTEMNLVDCDFSNYEGNGHRIAFRNLNSNGDPYSYNYLDDITLSESVLTPASLPYYTDFSENTDQNWRLKNGSCTNYWTIGVFDENSQSGLFITQDGITAGYNTDNNSTVIAEKAFHMPASDYVHVEFDVQIGGQNYNDYLKVFLTPVDEIFDASINNNNQSNPSYSVNALDFSDYKTMTGYTSYPYMLNLTNGNTLHISANMPNPHPNEIGKIVFLWRNNNYTGTQPGAVVSNFSIDEAVVFLPTVETGDISNITANTATCSGNVTSNGGLIVTARGVCWSTAPNPTLDDNYTVNDSGLGEFTGQLTNLTQGTVYYVRTYATNGAGTSYGEETIFTTDCGTLSIPYFNDFESYTEITTATTGVEPICWELVQEDVQMSDENRPQIYYKNSYAHSGDYSLMLNYRGVYAMPPLFDIIAIKHVHLEMYLRQPRSYYTLEVGVWEDDGTFVPVAAFNNSTTASELVGVDFSNYEGNGRRIAFRNLNSNGDAYSYNYIDDIMLTESEGCEITFEMHDSYGDGWNGNKILIHNGGTEKEVTLTSGYDGTATVMVHNGPIEFEWVNGSYTNECSFTVSGPCLHYEGNSMSSGVFHSMEINCEGGLPAVPNFIYWTEETCSRVIVHFENESTNAESAVWDFGDGTGSEEYSPTHEYTANGTYSVTLSVNNSSCENSYSISHDVTVTIEYIINMIPYTENFESYTEDTTATTGIEPTCWELVQEDVAMTEANRPQIYYKSSYANSGDYSLRLNYRGIYAMPILPDVTMKHIHLEMYLRQPRSYYTLEVGVWEDDGSFVPVATFNNSTTEMNLVNCDFSNYEGNGRRIAFRNLNSNGDAYSYNYLDDITLTETEGCEITFEMHDSYGDGWNGNKILIHNDGTEKEVTLTSGHEGTATVMVHNGPIEFEWVNGSYTNECSFTISGPCLFYEGNSMSPGVFHSMEMNCEGSLPATPDFSYWTEETCNGVIVHFENNSANATSAVWDFGDGATSDEYSPTHKYTWDDIYQVTLSVFNNTCENGFSTTNEVYVTMSEPVVITLPYNEDFESYTSITTPTTGVEPCSWVLVQEDVQMSDENRPQIYYKNSYAHSGDYSLMLNYRGIYAMPALAEYIDMSQIHLEMYLRQPKAYYALEVGIWEDGVFVPVATFNNSTTGVELVECDFSEYAGGGHRIAFRNLNTNGDAYSYNYLDDITLTFIIPAGDAQPCPGHETVTDYDGNVYNTVQIGEQCWMKENLRVTHYEDGVEIPLVSNIASVDIAYRYNPDNNGNNVSTYGYLYNWAAIMHGNASNNDNPGSVQGICPQGWHLPSEAEWEQLMNYTYSIQAYLCNEDSYVKALAAQTGWYSSDNTCSVGNNPNENNATGFSALPAGLYSGWGNNYDGYNYYADFWSATQNDDWQAMLYHINYEQDYVDQYINDKYDGKSVRCVLGEGYNLAAVTTDWANATSSNSAVCFGNVTYDGNTAVTECGVCWNTEPNPTLANAHTSEGGGTGVFTSTLTNLTEGATYYVRAYATNNMGTVYGDNVTFTTCGGFLTLPYTDNFDYYTVTTTPATGIEPACWELVQEDVPMSDANRPQLYYKSAYAHSGNYSLMLNYRGVYAMPSLSEDIPMNQVHLEMYLRQPRDYYALEVGIWENDDTFVPVATFNNSTTGVEFVACDFSEYTGDGHRIAFRNLNTNGDAYGYNYLDDITLKFAIPAGDAKPCPGHETVTDYDGNVYNTVKIGEQCWMKENLRVTKYEDGKEIPDGNSTSYDIAYHYNPGNDVNNVSTYGLLYNWPAVMHGLSSSDANPSNIQGVCPSGWHVPSISEWDQLNDYVSSVYAYTCGGNIAKSLASTTGWESSDIPGTPGYDQDQNNATGFSALPATCYGYWCGICGGASWCTIGSQTNFWSTTNAPNFSPSAYSPMIIYNIDSLYRHSMVAYNSHAYSVRCVLGEGYNLAAVTTNWVNTISSSSAICGGNVTYEGNTTVTERGVCWSFEPNPTIANEHTVDGSGLGEFTTQLTDLWESTTYYVRAYATNSMGTVYGEEVSFTTCGGTLALPYSEDFENYTATTAASTGVEPACWELVQEDVEMPENKRPQLYYKSAFAHSGDYSLKMDYRGVYAMPPIEENMAMKHVHLGMYLRQPNAAYRLQVGVWDDATYTFTPVATFNNSTTEVEFVECDFSNYTGNGRRVAFRNVLASGANYAYSYNYLDDITLTETEGCELTIEMHSQDWSWDGSYIRVHTDGSVKEVTLNSGYEETATVTVHNGTLELEWVNGWWPDICSFTASGLPCLYYSTETAPTEGVFYSTEIDCEGDNTTAIPDFSYWTENTCNNVIVHFENNSADADYFVWDFGDWITSEEWAPTHEYTEGTYLVTLSVNNGSCEDFSVIRKYIEVNMPEPITTSLDTFACAAELPLTWYGQTINHGGIYSTTLQSAAGCDSIVYMNFNLIESTFAHTPDTIVSANEPVTLRAEGIGDFIWTDADGNIIGEGNNITVIPTENTTYYVTKSGENLIQGNFVNGNFEQGNTGFSSQYGYYSSGACGCYYIGNNSFYWNSGYGYTADHTSGSGLFMMVDASSYSTIWSQTIDVTPHTNYVFGAWFLTLSYANISYYINGENITNFDFIETGNIWEQHSGTWYSGDNTTATFSINTEWADCGGYDFGIDDIMFYSGSCTSTESITLTLLPTGDAQPCPSIPTMTDYDGNVYNTVKIGNQCWMKENLKTTHYADGNEIALGEETSLSIPYRYAPGYSWEDHSYNVEAYGYLYNWAAVMNGANSSSANPSGVQGICPDGWHVPSNAEWAQLTDYLNSEPVYQCSGSSEIANALVLPEGWSWWWDNECNPGYSNENTSGFNTTGFSIRPAGSYDGDYTININGNYYDFSSFAAFWSSTKSNTRNAWGIQLYCNNANVYRYYFNKDNGFSVRCVYNETIASIPTVETGDVMFITPTYATCGGNVTDDGGAAVIERGICWSSEHSPTLEDNSIIDGSGTGEWQTILSNLTESTTYYVRAYATNSMGTSYGEVITFTTTTCEPIAVPYFENFDEYTLSTTASTGVEPACWDLVQEDVAITETTRPQLYYKSSFAHSGNYSLKMGYRCVYAMPELDADISLNQLTLDMYLRQANAAYQLEVGVWDDETQTFEAVQLFNNSSTNVEHVTCDFANYTGNGHRIAFRNVLADGANFVYSYNYLDDITLTVTANKIAELANANAMDADMMATDRDQVDVVVYPNPTKDVVNVECTIYNLQCSGIEVIDVYGKIITTVDQSTVSVQTPTQINVSGLAAGMYFVRVTTDRGVVTKPFVKR